MVHVDTASGLVLVQSPAMLAAEVPHAFTTRVGGVSPRPFDSLNLGIASAASQRDEPARIEANFQRLQTTLGCVGRRCITVSQVHGCEVAMACGRSPDREAADALITDDAGVLVAVRVADCVPILLATADGRAVAAVHAGWRGIVAGVLPRAVGAMVERLGAAASELLAAIGPCVGVEAYEVGPEVATAFELAGLAAAIVPRSPRPHIDLRLAVRMQLEQIGLLNDAIDVSADCTVAQRQLYFSHRRDGPATGRMAAVIGPGR